MATDLLCRRCGELADAGVPCTLCGDSSAAEGTATDDDQAFEGTPWITRRRIVVSGGDRNAPDGQDVLIASLGLQTPWSRIMGLYFLFGALGSVACGVPLAQASALSGSGGMLLFVGVGIAFFGGMLVAMAVAARLGWAGPFRVLVERDRMTVVGPRTRRMIELRGVTRLVATCTGFYQRDPQWTCEGVDAEGKRRPLLAGNARIAYLARALAKQIGVPLEEVTPDANPSDRGRLDPYENG